MAFTKPSTINSLWATSGTRVVPPSSKRSLGWIAEKPSYQYFNDILYKLGQANAYFNSRGVAEWDDETEYVGEKSYIVGSDGSLYKCLVTNTDQNPVLDDGTYWKIIANGQGSESWNILFPYEAGALVLHDGELWLATSDSTGSEPSDVNTDWDKLIRSADIATVSEKGIVELATQVEVDTGTNISKVVTPSTLANSDLANRVTELEGMLLGVGQTWQDVTSSRSANTNYTNSTGRPIMAIIFAEGNVGRKFYVDSVEVATINGGSDSGSSMSVIIPNNSVYYVDGTVPKWVELR